MYIFIASVAPTAIHDLAAIPSSPNSIYISWDHPLNPNSQLTQYIVYYRADPSMVQMFPGILSDGFNIMGVPSPVTTTSYNLTGLDVFTNYTIHMSVMGDGIPNAPIEVEILQRTNASGMNTGKLFLKFARKCMWYDKNLMVSIKSSTYVCTYIIHLLYN